MSKAIIGSIFLNARAGHLVSGVQIYQTDSPSVQQSSLGAKSRYGLEEACETL